MRHIAAFNHVSADGYFAAPDGNMGWFGHDEEVGDENAAGLSQTDAMIFGRRTFEVFRSFWPTAGDNPQAPASVRAMAKWFNESTKLVFSTTLENPEWQNTRVMRTLDPRDIAALKEQPGKSIMMFGSGTIVSQLTEHGLIDEYKFLVQPVFLGKGRSLISDVSKRVPLKLESTKQYSSGSVMLNYVRAV